LIGMAQDPVQQVSDIPFLKCLQKIEKITQKLEEVVGHLRDAWKRGIPLCFSCSIGSQILVLLRGPGSWLAGIIQVILTKQRSLSRNMPRRGAFFLQLDVPSPPVL
jgi:hypothetical protein